MTEVAVGSSIRPTSVPARKGDRPKYGPVVEKIGMKPKCEVSHWDRFMTCGCRTKKPQMP